jgi:hypothetical protein
MLPQQRAHASQAWSDAGASAQEARVMNAGLPTVDALPSINGGFQAGMVSAAA